MVVTRFLALTLAAGFFFASTIADARQVYRWETDDGVIAFGDDVKRIPDRYRSKAKLINTKTLPSTKRFSKVGKPAEAGHQDVATARLAHLRDVYSSPEVGAATAKTAGETVTIAGDSAGRFVPRVVSNPDRSIDFPKDYLTTRQARELIADGRLNRSGLRLGRTDNAPVFRRRSGSRNPAAVPNLNFSADPNSDEPIVVEKQRVRSRDAVTTQTVTVIRQGDKVLGVIKPRAVSHRVQGWEEDPY